MELINFDDNGKYKIEILPGRVLHIRDKNNEESPDIYVTCESIEINSSPTLSRIIFTTGSVTYVFINHLDYSTWKYSGIEF